MLFCLLLIAPVQAQPITIITSPAPFQIFQRDTQSSGAIWISGETTPETLTTGVWGDFSLPPVYSDLNGHFEALWPDLPIWQHDLILTIDGTEYTVENVGIGDVYIVAGQSNAVGHGNNDQLYTNTLGLRAGMFTFEGWKELSDPTGIRSDDTNAGGSEWPLLASLILEQGIPVAFVPTAKNSTAISQWQPGQFLYEDMHTRIQSLPAPYARAVLWQQGENDANMGMSANYYAAKLETIADSLYADFNLPLFAAYLSNYVYTPKSALINQGITKAVNEREYIYLGADLHAMSPNLPNVHYLTDAKLQKEAQRWYLALQAAGFYP